ncbi:MAG: tRNA (adenosine(37)-N6)-threonylcarbamoyltransferase complex transferase subunit TsaD [Candidatus Nomurabacteria bacterium]|jgi:N6-L-threonylcarbamoyladenine synthase|nr:tRNA (adenosine(37)-N6)-threonylcarbamoyltransferase complex transferase subunit TsaD [Candidatus Nomurabacteria bacterium]
MKILGIETSCDETAAAVVQDGVRILSNVVVSQIDIHRAFGGVVPEVAARSHIEAILPVVDEAVRPVGWNNIDAIAVTTQPGLIGSLLIGTLTARTLALVKQKPLLPINHIEAHVYANFLQSEKTPLGFSASASRPSDPSRATSPCPSGGDPVARLAPLVFDRGDDTENPKEVFPILALVVSGGHTQIMLFRGHGDYEVLGRTRDDAVGEAFDKVAKILGLPYPGGPSIAAAAERGDAHKYALPHPKLDNPLDFSFSGLKTAVLRAVQAECGKDYTFPSNALSELLSAQQRDDFAASFQNTAVEILVEKTTLAFAEFRPRTVVIAGGVAANQELRRQLAARLPVEISFAPPALCTDNAAMVASLGYFISGQTEPMDLCHPEMI